MANGGLFHKIALRGERIAEALDPRSDDAPVIEPYHGYATPDSLVLRGRVLTALRRTEPDPRQSRLTNLSQMVSLFFTNEVANVPVACGDQSTRSDQEGYFMLVVPRGQGEAGWREVEVEIPGRPGTRTRVDAVVPPDDAPAFVVCDIDDTVLQTGAWSIARNLWTSLTGNARSRSIYEDAAHLLKTLEAAGCPIFYVSSSPWNMHSFLVSVFERNGVPPGPMFLRDLGVSEKKFVKSGHGAHKSAAIDELMTTHPEIPAILIGDTGQADARIYADAVGRWPGRAVAIVLRRPRPGMGRVDKAALATLEEKGVAVHVTEDFSTVPHLLPRQVSEGP